MLGWTRDICICYCQVSTYPWMCIWRVIENLDRHGCHRSALGVCKFLLLQDYDDSTGAIFCIDYVTLLLTSMQGWKSFLKIKKVTTPFGCFQILVSPLRVRPPNKLVLILQKLLHPSYETTVATSSLVISKLVTKVPLKDCLWIAILHQFMDIQREVMEEENQFANTVWDEQFSVVAVAAAIAPHLIVR